MQRGVAIGASVLVVVVAAACGSFGSSTEPSGDAGATAPAIEAGSTSTSSSTSSSSGGGIVIDGGVTDGGCGSVVDAPGAEIGDWTALLTTNATKGITQTPFDPNTTVYSPSLELAAKTTKPTPNATAYVERSFPGQAGITSATLQYDIGFRGMVAAGTAFGCRLRPDVGAQSAGVASFLVQGDPPMPSPNPPPPAVVAVVQGDGAFAQDHEDADGAYADLAKPNVFHHVTTTLSRTDTTSYRFDFDVDGHATGSVAYPLPLTFDTLTVSCGILAMTRANVDGVSDLAIQNVRLDACR